MSIIKKATKNPKPTFVSHISSNGDAKSSDMKVPESCFYVPLDGTNEMQMEVDLLPGEIVISCVKKVTQYVPYSNDNTGHVGTLFVTNYKVSFVTLLMDRTPAESRYSGRRNKLIGKDDVALTNITDIYHVSKGRRKKLKKGDLTTTIGFVQCLELHCKDFRIHSFSFENCDRAEVTKTINTIVHHSFPARSDLLFVFSFQASKEAEVQDVPNFLTAEDWESELGRLQASQHFRVTKCNVCFAVSENLPEYFVVPGSCQDADITDVDKRGIPIWSYSYANGCALVRLPYGSTADPTNKMIGFVKENHPMKRKPKVIDLGVGILPNGILPSIRDLQVGFERLREMCMPSTHKDLWSSDLTWYSALEGCQWLHFVSVALYIAYDVVEKLSFENRSVVIQEKDGGTDFTPVIVSLAQLMMDPQSRTIMGIQSLIEKEWVASGHRFADRCGIIYQSNSEESPLFLLFLDCVWQLHQQFPSSFEFSEIYLTSLWDSVGLAMFRNFIFNGPKDHSSSGAASPRTKSVNHPMSVWDWEKQFYAGDIALFTNPLYVAHEQIQSWQSRDRKFAETYRKLTKRGNESKTGSLSPKQTINARKIWRLQSSEVLAALGSEVLRPGFKAPQIKLWDHCYLRWLTPIQIVGGGMPSEFLAQGHLMEEIRNLQDKIAKVEMQSHLLPLVGVPKKPGLVSARMRGELAAKISECISSSYPYSPTRPPNLSIFPVVSPTVQRSSLVDDSSVEEYSC